MEYKTVTNEILRYAWDRAIIDYTRNRFISEAEVEELFSIFCKKVDETITEIDSLE